MAKQYTVSITEHPYGCGCKEWTDTGLERDILYQGTSFAKANDVYMEFTSSWLVIPEGVEWEITLEEISENRNQRKLIDSQFRNNETA